MYMYIYIHIHTHTHAVVTFSVDTLTRDRRHVHRNIPKTRPSKLDHQMGGKVEGIQSIHFLGHCTASYHPNIKSAVLQRRRNDRKNERLGAEAALTVELVNSLRN